MKQDSELTNKTPGDPRLNASQTSVENKQPLHSEDSAGPVRGTSGTNRFLAGLFSRTERAEAVQQKQSLDQAIHRLLIIGLIISTSLMLVGLAMVVTFQGTVPTSVPDLNQVIAHALALQPSGFLSLGLLVLIATPIMRVVGSVIAFLYERDWLYAGVTFIVLLIVLTSIIFGKG